MIFLLQNHVLHAAPRAQADPLPDLVVESVITTPSAQGTEGAVDITITIRNQGDGPAKGFRTYLYADQADNPPTSETPFIFNPFQGFTILPGGSFSFGPSDRVFDSMTPDLKVWVDPPWENSLAESDETNNLYPSVAVEPPEAGQDAYEDNNECAAAKLINLGEIQEHNLFRNPDADVDWAYFEAVAGTRYLIQAIADGADADVYIEPYDECGGAPPFGSGYQTEITVTEDGPFYLQIRHNRSEYGPETDYRLRVDVTDGCVARFEPNDMCTIASSLTLSNTNAAPTNAAEDDLMAQTFCKPQDVDWMRFEATAGETYTLGVKNLGEKADTQLDIFESCEDAASVLPPSLDGLEYQITAAKSGFLYVKASHVRPDEFGYGTRYRIDVEAVGSEVGCTADAHEDDDTIEQAKPFALNVQKTYNSCPAADPDWVKFDAVAGETYSIETFNLAADADTKICLYDSAGDELICNDDGGADKASRIIWPTVISGSYFVKMTNLDTEIAGDPSQFDLTIRTDDCRVDAYEPDSLISSARLVQVDSLPTEHNICSANDEDWIWFRSKALDSYVIETSNTGIEADTIIELYDAEGTLLDSNDDFQRGVASRLTFEATEDASYFARVRLYNPSNFGTGTEYSLQLRSGEGADPDPPIVIVEPNAAPTGQSAPSTGVNTLILVNQRSISEEYGNALAAQLMVKLGELADHPKVGGKIIQLNDHFTTSNAYSIWKADLTSVEKANQTASSIRQLIQQELRNNGSVEYIVLVGDDRALPFYRVPLNTPLYQETRYARVTANHPTGAALQANFYLTDDYFADSEPTSVNGRDLYLPDLAIGRLVETPADMISVIDAFMDRPVTPVDNVSISAYTFVKDAGDAECDIWQERFGADGVDCSLIGESWNSTDWTTLNLSTANPFEILAINGHATHNAYGTPLGVDMLMTNINSIPNSMPGSLVYSMSCHAGLNVPPQNEGTQATVSAIDGPETFVRKGANYVGSTGYSFGSEQSIRWTEAVLVNFSEFLADGEMSMGQALSQAKSKYFREKPLFTAYDEKTVQQLVFYGLPMFEISGRIRALSPDDDEFPSVVLTTDTGPLSLGTLITGTATIDFPAKSTNEDEPLALQSDERGDYYALHGHTTASAGQPVQPLHFGDVSRSDGTLRSAIILSASYTMEAGFTPPVALPINEYTTPDDELPQALSGTYPPVSVDVRADGGASQLVTTVSQYDAEKKEIRVLDDVEVELFYSNSPDQTAPTIFLVNSNYDEQTKRVDIKVEAGDESAVEAVFVTYFDDSVEFTGVLHSSELQYDDASQKWKGSFTHNTQPKFYVQVVDTAGNARAAVNKGFYFTPDILAVEEPGPAPVEVEVEDPDGMMIFLPTVMR